MDMNPATVWWLIAGGLVAIELATGTFFLLMLAIDVVPWRNVTGRLLS